MSWSKSTQNKMLVLEETITGPNATTVYSSEISEVIPSFNLANKKIGIYLKASAVATDLTVDIYGSYTSGGTKVKLASNVLSGNIGTTSPSFYALDVNAYPAPYYYIAIVSTADNSSNTVDVKVMIPAEAQ